VFEIDKMHILRQRMAVFVELGDRLHAIRDRRIVRFFDENTAGLPGPGDMLVESHFVPFLLPVRVLRGALRAPNIFIRIFSSNVGLREHADEKRPLPEAADAFTA
jgi:hypothetical protein